MAMLRQDYKGAFGALTAFFGGTRESVIDPFSSYLRYGFAPNARILMPMERHWFRSRSHEAPGMEGMGRHLAGAPPRALVAALRHAVGMRRRHKRALVFLLDLLLCLAATFIAFSLRVGALSFPPGPPLLYACFAAAIYVPTFLALSIYASIFRYSGGRTMARIALGVCIGAIPLIAAFMLLTVPGIPRTIAILQPMIFFGLLATSRILVGYLTLQVVASKVARKSTLRVLIYGAGAAGQQLAVSLRHESGMQAVGFVEDDELLADQYLDGLRIYRRERLDDVVQQRKVDTILLALPQVSRARKREIVESLRHLGLHVRTLPNLGELAEGKVSVNDLREVQIEDLLGRDQVAPNTLLFARTIVGRCVMVTGAGGSIGSELCRQIAGNGARRLVLFEMSEFALYAIERELQRLREAQGLDALEIVPVLGSVCDAARLAETFARWRPETVFHAAAYKHVPLVEANPVEGVRNNVLGTHETVRAAVDAGVRDFTLVSTDKAVRPTNVMGASKRSAEQVAQAYAAQAKDMRIAIVRFGNVLGSSGSVVPLFRQQIEAGGPVTLTHREVTRFFMTIPEAAQLVIQAGGLARGGEVFVLDMGQPVRILDLARSMIQLSGLSVRDDTDPDGDIAIREVGLRPGEKLYEELLIGEDPQSTIHERIMMARESFMPWDRLEPMLSALRETRESASVLALLHAMVPEFAHDRDKVRLDRRREQRA